MLRCKKKPHLFTTFSHVSHPLFHCVSPLHVSAVQHALHWAASAMGWGSAGSGCKGLGGGSGQTGADQWAHVPDPVQHCLRSPGTGTTRASPEGLYVTSNITDICHDIFSVSGMLSKFVSSIKMNLIVITESSELMEWLLKLSVNCLLKNKYVHCICFLLPVLILFFNLHWHHVCYLSLLMLILLVSAYVHLPTIIN